MTLDFPFVWLFLNPGLRTQAELSWRPSVCGTQTGIYHPRGTATVEMSVSTLLKAEHTWQQSKALGIL